ncbi:MAG: helix-turn-helix transcriptional regulator [Victivallales bacterium]|nr:helix-turn-helix transcriptional regulator [Victivallales bacterium]
MHPRRIIDSFELIFVTSGTLKMREESEVFEVHAGCTLLLFPGCWHEGVEQYSSDLRFYWFHFIPFKREGEILLDSVSRIVQVSEPERMTVWFRQLLGDAASSEPDKTLSSILLALMLADIANPGNADRQASKPLAVRVHDYISVNYSTPMTTSLIADSLHCNPDYLGRIFKESYGMTITEKLNAFRLSQARRLLLENPMNINEIAEASGFNDIAYFRRAFKKSTGLSPAAFRKQYGKVHINTN